MVISRGFKCVSDYINYKVMRIDAPCIIFAKNSSRSPHSFTPLSSSTRVQVSDKRGLVLATRLVPEVEGSISGLGRLCTFHFRKSRDLKTSLWELFRFKRLWMIFHFLFFRQSDAVYKVFPIPFDLLPAMKHVGDVLPFSLYSAFTHTTCCHRHIDTIDFSGFF